MNSALTFDDVLDADLLRAAYQPIVAAHGMDVIGYEGLIRGPEGTAFAQPAALFAAAQASARQLELQMRCLRTVWKRFASQDLPGKLFMNVSVAMLVAPRQHQRELLRLLASSGLDSRRVVLEITEEQGVTDFRRLRRMAALLRRLGFSLAIDDLGAGFASLRMWLELRPDWVKIDRKFISDVESDAVKQAFLRAIRDIGRTCGSSVIAEGIETAAEMAYVRELGIGYCQGFHIARPGARPALP